MLNSTHLKRIFFSSLFLATSFVFAQVEEEEDWDLYDNFELEDDTPVKRYAKPTISGMSPQKFITVGWDMQMPYNMEFSETMLPSTPNNGLGYGVDDNVDPSHFARSRYTGGLRIQTNIPVISKSNFVWQTGINFMDTSYNVTDIQGSNINPTTTPALAGKRSLAQILNEDGLRNLNWTNTFFIPINEKSFIVFQNQLDMSGNYDFGFQPLNTIRYSVAAVYGQRVSDNKRWGVGASRTYRVGNLNYIPVLMYDWTSKDRKWGTEILFPARAHVRYNFSKDALLLAGFELEGQSYRIDDYSAGNNSFEIRRGELRPRIEFQRKLTGYIWASAQVGYRIDYSYDADELNSSRDFFRGFFGEQEFAMRNNLANTFYFNVGLSFVSP
jgi:hypothetical protein